MAKCTQCGGPPFIEYSGHLLCLSCYEKFQGIVQRNQDDLASLVNFYGEMVDRSMGIPGLAPRIPRRQPVVRNAPVYINQIHLDRSVVGAINTGTANKIEVSMSRINAQGQQELVDLIKRFTETLAASEIDQSSKELAAEHIAFLAEQAGSSPECRNPGVARTILSTVKDIAQTAVAVKTIWPMLELALRKALGI